VFRVCSGHALLGQLLNLDEMRETEFSDAIRVFDGIRLFGNDAEWKVCGCLLFIMCVRTCLVFVFFINYLPPPPLWGGLQSACNRYNRFLVPIEELAASKLSRHLGSMQSQPHQMLQEFQKYSEVVRRDIVFSRLGAFFTLVFFLRVFFCFLFFFGGEGG
jgi:hypothetical protein